MKYILLSHSPSLPSPSSFIPPLNPPWIFTGQYKWLLFFIIELCAPAQCALTLCGPMDYSLPVSIIYEIVWAKNWSGLPFPPPGDFPDPGMESVSPALAGGFFTPSHLGIS